MKNKQKVLAVAIATLFTQQGWAAEVEKLNIDEVEVHSSVIDSRIMKHPATVETYDRSQIDDSVNAATPAQTMKYMPSIQVRERFIGDRNGIIANRTIGAISSAQSLLYADGILLSNLLGNSYSYPPRWGMVSPEEIQSISMMYGPFSSLYAGNSLGGVISINTRMPEKFEAHANVQGFMQNFKLYGTNETLKGNHESASVGNKINDFSFFVSADRLENRGQPLDFSLATTTASSAVATAAVNDGSNKAVTGAYSDLSEKGLARKTFGAYNIDDSIQTNTKIKIAYDISPELKVTYSLGLWDLDGKTDVKSYIKDASGNPVYGGSTVTFNGATYSAPAMSPALNSSFHIMQAIDLQSKSKDPFNWQVTLSSYDYNRDISSASKLANNKNPYTEDFAGQVTDQGNSGWTVFESRGTFKLSEHTIDFGYHQDNYQLSSLVYSAADWRSKQKGALSSSSKGNTQTQAVYLQDKWQIDPHWALTFGGREESWEALKGHNQTTTSSIDYSKVTSTKFSPKISLNYEPIPAWGFRASYGKAYRFPTVTEMYQQLSTTSGIIQNNPNLKPEEVNSAELTAERRFANGLVRLTYFNEQRYDALISQTVATSLQSLSTCPAYVAGNSNATQCTFTQNVDHLRVHGVELASEWQDFLISRLDLHANATVTSSKVLQDALAPSYVGKVVNRLPSQLYKVVATYHVDDKLTMTLAGRFSGHQYINLDNSDINSDVYKAASRFLFVDVKANYKFSDRWTASIGVDNINNDKAYVSHPYPQRTGYLQMKFDY